ncbi:MAG: alpha/beta hydrolase [Planctomycetes bacterium]|nr:alpha/beta hydrolase [Planctomycetota bacterium]
MLALLLVLGGGYVAITALVWLKQDGMVFAGAGFPDRGVPILPTPVLVRWLGEGGERGRIATVTPRTAPIAVAVYFGGNGEDLYAAAFAAGELADYGLETFAHEHPGYGASPGSPSVASFLAAAERTVDAAALRARELGVPLVVIGSSLGTFCAVHVAARGGAAPTSGGPAVVDRLVLRAPPTTLAAAAKARFGFLPVDLLLRHRFDNATLAPRVTCPVLVLHGDRDGIVPQALGRELAALLPHGRFVGVPGAGHNNLYLSVQAPVAAELRAFVSAK